MPPEPPGSSANPRVAWGRFLVLVACLLAIRSVAAAAGAPGPVPLPQAHAHNDYEHPRPLFDALACGFCSVEADIHLLDGQLLVAHDRADTKPERTLEALYLAPLRERIEQNGGRVFRGGPEVILLIDIKSDADSTYEALKPVLRRYTNILTRFEPNLTHTNAITLILSGNRPRRMLESEADRYVAMDGRLDDLPGTASASLIPLVSDNWGLQFRWRGAGALDPAEQARLAKLVGQAHRAGRKIRFWATPDQPAVWKELQRAGVDLIGTDNLESLRDFLRAESTSR